MNETNNIDVIRINIITVNIIKHTRYPEKKHIFLFNTITNWVKNYLFAIIRRILTSLRMKWLYGALFLMFFFFFRRIYSTTDLKGKPFGFSLRIDITCRIGNVEKR